MRNRDSRKRGLAKGRLILALALSVPGAALAQQDRIAGPIDPSRRAILRGVASPKAQPQQDRGPVEPSFRLRYVTMLLKQTAAQHAALGQLLADQRNPASPDYRRWLSAAEYADRFGVSANDMTAISAWLRSAGFTVEATARGRDWIAFSGSAAQVQAAFGAPVHRYSEAGETHFAIAGDPSVPAALEPLAAAFLGLDDFNPKAPGHPRPAFTEGPGNYSLAPGDLATIYDLNRLYQAGYDGTGQSIAIVGQTSVDLDDIQGFRETFGLSDANVQMVQVGQDPGSNSNFLGEADLDLEWAGAVARNATLIYVYSTSADFAAITAIDQNLAPVISESYGTCEPDVAQSLPAAMQTEAQKGNSMGITWLAATGDTGAAECDYGASVASLGLAVNFPSSIPEVTAVGGTEFNELSDGYWSSSNSSTGGSALSYIPEKAWNDTAFGGGLSASGGGVSILFPKPSWQTGAGVPADGSRDVPDVSMDAANDHDPYNILTGGQWIGIGGTSAATPVFAGVLALVNQYLAAGAAPPQGGLGNINTDLYRLAQGGSNIFHDIVFGNNVVPCQAGTPNCVNGQFGYSTTPGYDLVTGLGSVDAYNLVVNWSGAPAGAVAIASLSPSSATAGGAGFTLIVNGSNFAAGAVVNWNGTALPTTLVGSTVLNASVTANLIASPGTVAITVSSGGKVSGALYFTINPSTPSTVSYSDQRVTAQAPPAAGCVLPPATSAFATTNGTVYLYFAATVAATDLLSNDWLAPDGSTVSGASWPQQAGDFCFTGASLPIGSLSGSKLGNWQARVYDNGKVLFSVTFSVSAAASAVPVIASVNNVASYAAGMVSPGELVIVFGSGLGPATIAKQAPAAGAVWGTQLAGTSVEFNGVPAPIIYTLASAVAVVVPYEVNGANAQVTLTYQGKTSAPFSVPIVQSVPGLFTANASGSGQAAALNQDSSINSATHPAAQQSVVQLFATGEGQTTPGGVDGKPISVPYPKPNLPVSVTIGGISAHVDYAGGAPTLIAGVMQVNATIPAGVFGSSVPVVVKVGDAQSQANTTIAIAANAGEASFNVTSMETAASVVTSHGNLSCTAPASKTAFLTTDPFVWVYFTYDGAVEGDILSYNWVHPSGSIDAQQPTATLNFSGSGCSAQSFAISGAEAATEPGNWQVRVFRNGTQEFALTFTVVAPPPTFAVTNKMTTGAIVTDSNGNLTCTAPVQKTAFLSTDPLVWTWFAYNGVANGDVFSFNWIHPNGALDSYQPTSVVNFSGSGCTAWSFDIAGFAAASDPGNWQVKVFRNGTLLFTLPFTIANAGFAVTNKMTTGAIVTDGEGNLTCTTPVPKTAFLPTDPLMWVWFSYDGVQSGDVFAFNWIHPSGAVDSYQPSTVATFNGSGCAAWSFDIAGFEPSTEPGTWQVKTFRNGTLLFSLPFTIAN